MQNLLSSFSSAKMESERDLCIGVINPFALTECLLGRAIDWTRPETAEILSAVLGTDYNELFDMKFRSPLYAGLRVDNNSSAEPLKSSEVQLRKDRDLQLPNLGTVEKLSDLEKFGVKDITRAKVRRAWVERGKVNVVMDIPELDRRMTNKEVTQGVFELTLPFRKADGSYTPNSTSWVDMEKLSLFRSIIPHIGMGSLAELENQRGPASANGINALNSLTQRRFVTDILRKAEYNDPIQGAVGNSYFIAALSAVAWSDPSILVRPNPDSTRHEQSRGNKEQVAIRFHSKGGRHDAPSATIEINEKVLVHNATRRPVYARSNNFHEMYAALYEKAFAKWINRSRTEEPDITQTAYGDPVIACAQITDRKPHYFETVSRSPDELYGIVREHCLNMRTLYPMVAWTHATGPDYRGCNIVANHAYSILGRAQVGEKEYIILRNPWGVTEPHGLNTYQGMITSFDEKFWQPISTIDNGGVFALEPAAFKFYFAGLGVAKD
jgi:Calpain family cysteine protease